MEAMESAENAMEAMESAENEMESAENVMQSAESGIENPIASETPSGIESGSGSGGDVRTDIDGWICLRK